MLVISLLRGLYTRIAISFSILLFVLATADVLMRLGQTQIAGFLPQLFVYALPVISLFALPIAASLAVQTQMGAWQESSAIILFRSLAGMQRMLRRSLLFFSCTLGLCYLPLVFDIAPRSASASRNIVLHFAKDHLRKLEPHVPHQLGSGSLVFFHEKSERGDALAFKKILIRFRDGHGSHVVSAQEGVMHDDRLYLRNGTMHSDTGKHLSASFGSMHLDLDRFFPAPEGAKQDKASHLSFKQLWGGMFSDSKVTLEFHTRLVRLLWLLLFPFLALAGVLWFGREGQSGLAQSIAWSAGLFLVSYLIISVASACASSPLLAYPLLYGGSGAVWLCILRLGRRRW